jgi:hypothetical protein
VSAGTINEQGIVNVDDVDPTLLYEAILEAPSILFEFGGSYYVRIGTATAADADEQYPILRNQDTGSLFLLSRDGWKSLP